MKCPKCDFENPDTQKFCGDCGTQLSSLSVTKTLQTPLASSGKTIAGKYKILSELGRGGMGVVYKAKDTKLKRIVALKFLPAELTKDKAAKKRFIQEAQAAAAINHPQICTIYEVDEAEGQTFIAMEYIEGLSLKDKLKAGPLDIDEAKDIAIQVAEGLKEAHERGIVHRDIKPANIMLTKKGQAKITDFGLAKLSWGVDLTKTSTIMGTVAYMSPEQAKGEEIDQRTDIWSLGAMLYEMLAGERPFQKNQEQALIYAILNDKPTPLSLIRSDVPTHIEQVIDKAIAKKVSERYQNIQELIQDLTLSISFTKAEKSIVVLPFADLSPNRDNEYFSDGLTEEIISDLSSIQSIQVISRNTAMMFKGTRKSTKTIGKELDVQYVLEGSVRKAGNNLRITAQLIDATSDAHLWAKKYSGTLDDVFDIQEKVSQSIVDSLKVELSPEARQEIIEHPIPNAKAYECYLKAQKEIFLTSENSLARALKYIQDGMDIVGENPLFYFQLGYVYFQYENIGTKPDEFYLKKAEEYAQKVFELKPESSHGYFLLGLIHMKRGEFQDVVRDLKKRLAIEPNDTQALFWLILAYLEVGKTQAAEPLINRLLEIDPLSPFSHLGNAWFYFMGGQFDNAVEPAQRAFKLDPGIPVVRYYYALILAFNNKRSEANALLDVMIKEIPDASYSRLALVTKYALNKDKVKLQKSITPEFINFVQRDDQYSWILASCFALINEKDKALKWLENAVNESCFNYPFLNEYNSFLDNIRSEPRFKKLMERVKHEWENFEV